MVEANDALAEVRHLVLEYLRPWQVRVWLFGSRARGDASPGSDIDIALLPEEETSVFVNKDDAFTVSCGLS